jgi:hypothetical protein
MRSPHVINLSHGLRDIASPVPTCVGIPLARASAQTAVSDPDDAAGSATRGLDELIPFCSGRNGPRDTLEATDDHSLTYAGRQRSSRIPAV